MGGKVPAIYGPSADENPFAKAEAQSSINQLFRPPGANALPRRPDRRVTSITTEL
jgi:hypothetical protein